MNNYDEENQEENWRGPGAREGEGAGEIWIGPEAGMSRLRPFKVARMMRGPAHVELGANALSDARLDAREDARARDMLDVCERTLQRLDQDLDYADVSHPHGEALGPGAQTHCTGREKHAFGGMHPQHYYAGKQVSLTNRQGNRGGTDAC
jgi:hypothetical protein